MASVGYEWLVSHMLTWSYSYMQHKLHLGLQTLAYLHVHVQKMVATFLSFCVWQLQLATEKFCSFICFLICHKNLTEIAHTVAENNVQLTSLHGHIYIYICIATWQVDTCAFLALIEIEIINIAIWLTATYPCSYIQHMHVTMLYISLLLSQLLYGLNVDNSRCIWLL